MEYIVIPHNIAGGGPGAVGKAACLESQRSRARTTLWHLYLSIKRFKPIDVNISKIVKFIKWKEHVLLLH